MMRYHSRLGTASLDCCVSAAVFLFNFSPGDLYSPYNAYEAKATVSCNTGVKGCCSGTLLTSFVQDTSVTYSCYGIYSYADPGVNSFQMTACCHPQLTELHELACMI